MSERNPQLQRGPVAQTPMRNPAGPTSLEVLSKGAAAVTEIAVNQQQEHINTQLQDELMDQQDATLDALERADTENLSPSEYNSIQEFAAHMQKLQEAADQRSRSITELKINQERTLREYMARYPKLVPQLQAAATGVLGYQPLGARMRAAEQSAGGSGGPGLPDILRMYIQQAVSAGVPLDLYYSNQEEFWRQASFEIRAVQQAKQSEQEVQIMNNTLGAAATAQRGLLGRHMQNLSHLAWQQDIAPRIRDFNESLGINGDMTDAERASRIAEAKRNGDFQAIQAALNLAKATAMNRLYEEYATNPSFQVGVPTRRGVMTTVPLSREEFAQYATPVLGMYDWAIQTLGEPYANEHVRNLNMLREDGILANVPTGAVAGKVYLDLFKNVPIYQAQLAQGEVGLAVISVWEGAALNAIGSFPPGRDPTPGPVIDPNTGEVNPNNIGGRQPTVNELQALQPGATPTQINNAYTTVTNRLLLPTLDNFEQTAQEDPALASQQGVAVLLNTLTYANMTQAAERAGQPRPAARVDDAYVRVMSHPNFGKVVRHLRVNNMTTDEGMDNYNQGMLNLMFFLREGLEVRMWDAESRFRRMLEDPYNYLVEEGRLPFPGFKPSEGFVKDQFINNIEVEIDPSTGIPSFSPVEGMEDDILTGIVVNGMNRLPAVEREAYGRYAMAYAHIQGQGADAYDDAFFDLLGFE